MKRKETRKKVGVLLNRKKVEALDSQIKGLYQAVFDLSSCLATIKRIADEKVFYSEVSPGVFKRFIFDEKFMLYIKIDGLCLKGSISKVNDSILNYMNDLRKNKRVLLRTLNRIKF